MAVAPLVSCLCVTEDRAEFWPWLFWNVGKQTHRNLELVIVSPQPLVLGGDGAELAGGLPKTSVRTVEVNPSKTLGERRGLAVAEARGEYLAWFDDDDFSTPDRLEELVRICERTGGAFCGCRELWFWDLWADRSDVVQPSDITTAVAMNTALVRTELAKRTPFRKLDQGEDVRWMAELCFAAGNEGYFTPNLHGFCLSHSGNTANHRDRRGWTRTTSDVRRRLGRVALEGLDHELDRLRRRLRNGGRAPTIE